MVVHGHVENGIVIPDNNISVPDGTEVTIMVRTGPPAADDAMSEQERERYLRALARIDAVANENPGDAFSGADHDRVLYGEGSLSLWTREPGSHVSRPTIRIMPV